MPKVGIEPTRPEGHRILSPARLPIPPLRLGIADDSGRDARGQAVAVLTGGGRLPRPERGHPRRRAALLRARSRGRGRARGVARARRRASSSRSGRARSPGILPRGGTILGTTRTNPYKLDGGVEHVLETFRERRPRRARRDRRRGHARRRGAALRGARVPGRRRAEDDRQRPLRHRLHVRLRHGRDDRHRGDRPPAHDRRVAQPRDGRRGDGTPHRLDRRHERHRRRRRRHPDPGAADHGRGGLRGDPAAPRARQGLLDRRRQRGLRADVRVGRDRASSPARRARATSSATCASAGSATRSRARSRSEPGSRRA